MIEIASVDVAKKYLHDRFGYTGDRLEWEACYLVAALGGLTPEQAIDSALTRHELAPITNVDDALKINSAARAMYLGLKAIAFGTVREAGEVARETLYTAAQKLEGR